jgi:hypothetical protein
MRDNAPTRLRSGWPETEATHDRRQEANEERNHTRRLRFGASSDRGGEGGRVISNGGNMKLPADPRGRNDERAHCAHITLAAFMAETNTDESDARVEFLDGIMHCCDRSGESFEARLERARSLYHEETNETAKFDDADVKLASMREL